MSKRAAPKPRGPPKYWIWVSRLRGHLLGGGVSRENHMLLQRCPYFETNSRAQPTQPRQVRQNDWSPKLLGIWNAIQAEPAGRPRPTFRQSFLQLGLFRGRNSVNFGFPLCFPSHPKWGSPNKDTTHLCLFKSESSISGRGPPLTHRSAHSKNSKVETHPLTHICYLLHVTGSSILISLHSQMHGRTIR